MLSGIKSYADDMHTNVYGFTLHGMNPCVDFLGSGGSKGLSVNNILRWSLISYRVE